MPICPPAGSDAARRRAGPTAPGDERRSRPQPPPRVGGGRFTTLHRAAIFLTGSAGKSSSPPKNKTADPNAPGALISDSKQTFDDAIRGYGWWRGSVGAALSPPSEEGCPPTPPPRPSVGPLPATPPFPVSPTTKQLPAHQREALVQVTNTTATGSPLSPSLADRYTPASPRRPRGT